MLIWNWPSAVGHKISISNVTQQWYLASTWYKSRLTIIHCLNYKTHGYSKCSILSLTGLSESPYLLSLHTTSSRSVRRIPGDPLFPESIEICVFVLILGLINSLDLMQNVSRLLLYHYAIARLTGLGGDVFSMLSVFGPLVRARGKQKKTMWSASFYEGNLRIAIQTVMI